MFTSFSFLQLSKRFFEGGEDVGVKRLAKVGHAAGDQAQMEP
jgi:hypothetical protein